MFGKELTALIWNFSFFKPFAMQTLVFTTLWKKSFENIMGKGGNADDQHFLVLPSILFNLSKPSQIN